MKNVVTIKHTQDELIDNYSNFIKAIELTFADERLERLLFMYSENELGMNLMTAPASGNVHFHYAHDGGYIDHVMNVVKNSLKMKKLYESVGGFINFTDEELLFAAFHHDLGKLGHSNHPHYIPNDSEWHIKNRGDMYKRNPENSHMTHTDRTFFLLNEYGIKYNENEYFGIKLTDGMFDEDNVKYYKVFNPDSYLRSNIQYILHWADYMSTCVERDATFRTDI